MLTYHQCGHNLVWNLGSIEDDGSGEGLILSPLNVHAERIRDRVSNKILSTSWYDPQWYRPHDSKGKLSTYPHFPKNMLEEYSTNGFRDVSHQAATECLSFQHELGLRYLVIPARYFVDLPNDYIEQQAELYVEPYLKVKEEMSFTEPLLLTVIVKPLHLEFGDSRDELLSWVTSYEKIAGVYLIFEHERNSKQIKDPAQLAGALRFIRAIRQNGMEVHIGYAGIEGLLYSLSDPTSVAMGTYENVRKFDPARFDTESGGGQQPNPRVYSGRLLQWIEHTYLPPMRELVSDWHNYFEDTPYKEYLLDPDSSLNSQRPEIYKHYLLVYSQQVNALPALADRVAFIRHLIQSAMEDFRQIESAKVYLDENSDGSHLPAWLNAISMYEANPE